MSRGPRRRASGATASDSCRALVAVGRGGRLRGLGRHRLRTTRWARSPGSAPHCCSVRGLAAVLLVHGRDGVGRRVRRARGSGPAAAALRGAGRGTGQGGGRPRPAPSTYDPRAYLLLRTWTTGSAVRIVVADDRDPHPFWLVTVQRPRRVRRSCRFGARVGPTTWRTAAETGRVGPQITKESPVTRTDVLRLSAPIIAMGGVWVARKALTGGYEAATGNQPPTRRRSRRPPDPGPAVRGRRRGPGRRGQHRGDPRGRRASVKAEAAADFPAV